jgi:hypothetical protein
MDKQKTVLVIRESAFASLIKDAGSLAVSIGVFLPGVYFESVVMQVFGLVLLCALTVICAARELGRDRRLTVEQARQKLDEIEALLQKKAAQNDK